ncbi:nucleoside hydrolase [Photobacterium andalusiense]|uniref:Pyrimidine-specific ribonucleoside hydrolase RihB n=1 Tax=Photobacterium andalusiense TaxID=2204296 RepID=A0A1Y6MEN6_9GAMM|nr:nucleoside hydrolase [Photobacterium andalusiense]SMY34994.1 Pyrimidine-specific ribonucleoside hydrolase RihB [Photobacterium andalusiense]
MIKKIILDTDPGIDDAMAILFAESHPEIELVGLTTVFGNATIDNGTRNALYLKDRFHMQATIAKGASQPLVRAPVGPTEIVHGITGLGDFQIPASFTGRYDQRPAYQYIIDTVKTHPHEITLVAVGPLTNLALALQAAPEIADLVAEVVVMGGAFGVNDHRGNVTPYAEANIHDDPHAADIVFCASWPVTIIGLDVTEESFFSAAFLEQLRHDAGGVGEFIFDISRYYLRFYSQKVGLDGCHVHDPSAIAYVIDPTLFTTRKGAVRVVCDGPASGMTLQKLDNRQYQTDEWSSMPSQQVGVTVDTSRLLDLYRQTIIKYQHL